jgi:transmembrane sensor
MEKDYLISLIYKELKGEINAIETQELQHLLASNSENEALYIDIKLSWELSDQSIELDDLDVEGDLAKLTKRLPKKTSKTVLKPTAKVIPMRRKVLRVAAALLFIITSWLVIKNYLDNSTNDEITLIAQTEHLPFELPDGSTGVLKKGSVLKYQKTFLENRQTTLKGVASFKVKRDVQHPFRIAVNKGEVEVLGTAFTVYHEQETITVSVKEGKVAFSQNEARVILTAGQVGYCTSYEAAPIKTEMKSDNFNYWQEKGFRFDNETITSISEQLALIYGIKINILNDHMKTCRVIGVFKEDNPEKILQRIADQFNMKLRKTASNSFNLDEGICH